MPSPLLGASYRDLICSAWPSAEARMASSLSHVVSIADSRKYRGWCCGTPLTHSDLSGSLRCEEARSSMVSVPELQFVCICSSLLSDSLQWTFPCFRASLTPLLIVLKRAGPLWPLEAGCRSICRLYGPRSRLGILVAWFPRGGWRECCPVKCNQGLYSVCFDFPKPLAAISRPFIPGVV